MKTNPCIFLVLLGLFFIGCSVNNQIISHYKIIDSRSADVELSSLLGEPAVEYLFISGHRKLLVCLQVLNRESILDCEMKFILVTKDEKICGPLTVWLASSLTESQGVRVVDVTKALYKALPSKFSLSGEHKEGVDLYAVVSLACKSGKNTRTKKQTLFILEVPVYY